MVKRHRVQRNEFDHSIAFKGHSQELARNGCLGGENEKVKDSEVKRTEVSSSHPTRHSIVLSVSVGALKASLPQ